MIDTKSHDHKIIALAALMLVAFALVALLDGCAVHRQAPVRLIPYDFADRDFYDRSYAPSPSYAGAPPDQRTGQLSSR